MTSVLDHPGTQSNEGRGLPRLVDCDVHTTYPVPWQDALAPYLPKAWAVKVGARHGYVGPDAGNRAGSGFQLPSNGNYPLPQNVVRNELIDPDLPPPCSDPEISGHDLFDGYGVERAVILPSVSHQLLPMPGASSAIATACNRYQEEVWLAHDRRYRGLISVGWQDVESSVAEIERAVASSDRWVGVAIQAGPTLIGHPRFWPIYEAAERHGLVISLHTSGGAIGYQYGPSPSGGMPLYHLDFRVALVAPDQMNMASMISSGVFEKYPRLKLILVENGVGWLPQVAWTMDSFWKGNREDTPWLRRPPSEYIWAHVRLTTQPLFEPEKPEHIAWMLEMIHAEQTLMFATDYPHWDADDPRETMKRIPKAIRERVSARTAIETYGERLL